MTDQLQLGAAVSVPVNPSAFGSAFVTLNVGTENPHWAGRFDLGVVHGSTATATGDPSNSNFYVLAVGVPIRIKLASHVAFVSGGTTAPAFGLPLAYFSGGHGVALGANPFFSGQSWAAISVDSNGGIAQVLQAPVGVLFAHNDEVSLELRGAFREMATFNWPLSLSEYTALPLGADLLVDLGAFDVDVSFDLAGELNAPALGYTDLRELTFSVRARL